MATGLIATGRFLVSDSIGAIIKVTIPAPSTSPGKPWLADMLHQLSTEIAWRENLAS